jgi:4-alpha-glucanotransferase
VARFQLSLLIHAHQPVGNFESVLARAYEKSYLPFIQLLFRHPSLRVGLHYSGALWEWFEAAHPEYFEMLRELGKRKQVELIGGGFYEPILVAIPEMDAREQVERLANYLAQHFGQRPRGAWLTERVWEPQLPTLLAAAGMEYTLVDDNHFLSAGFEAQQLFGTYVAEDRGAMVRLIPGLKALRYLIPYRSPEEVIGYLRDAARARPNGMAAMGDDLEKFGVWTETYNHCYRDGWLERFMSALEANQEWLETVPPGEAVSSRPALGRADLPTCSYSEMMEWALPTSARLRYQALEREFSSREDARLFLRGGFWRNFLTKYPEANLMQKKTLLVSKKLRKLRARSRKEEVFRSQLDQATTELFRAQCNDAYWHGVFGGLYAPHLRTAVWRQLVRAETFADSLTHGHRPFAEARQFDFDCDGHEEIYVATDRAAILISPNDGATVEALDYRPAGVTLINSIMRRPEAYHTKLAQASTGRGNVASIHDQVRAKEPGLERRLKYDRWPRHSFRLLLFPAQRNAQDYENIRLDENAALAGGEYRVRESGPSRVTCTFDANPDGWSAEKRFTFSEDEKRFQLICDFSITHAGNTALEMNIGLETVVNLLAPNEPDRYIEVAGARYPLSWAGAPPASELHLVDEWQNVRVSIHAPGASDYWVAPIETISESEEGFERVYQGSQILAVWPVIFQPGKSWSGRLVLSVSSIA